MSPRIGLDVNSILRAASEIADSEGVEAVTLANLAKRLNIRPPSLYNHIDGLQGLRKKLSLFGIKELQQYLIRAAVGRSGDDAIRAMSEAYITFARKNPGLYEATFLTPGMQDSEIQQASSEVVQLVIQVLNHYGLENEAAVHATRGLRSLLHGFASIEQKGGFAIEMDANESFRFVIDTYLAGLKETYTSI